MKRFAVTTLILLYCIGASGQDYKIPLSPYAKFYSGDTVFYQLTDLTASSLAHFLIDEQAALDPLHGIVQPAPVTNFNSGFPSNLTYPAVAVIDLGGLYRISAEVIYDNFGTDSIKWQFGNPDPAHWGRVHSHAEQDGKRIAKTGFKEFNDVVTTRFIKVYYANTGYQKINELFLYGHLVGNSLSRRPPVLRTKPYANGETVGTFLGLNTTGAYPKPITDNLAGNFRDYENQQYADTSVYQHKIDSVNFVFDKFSINSLTYHYYFPGDTGGFKGPLLSYYSPGTPGQGQGAGMVRTHPPFYLFALQGVNQMEYKNGWTRSIDYVNHPDADSTDPASYDRLSRMAWQFGAAFGKNTYPASELQFTIPASGSGLNLIQFVETGNENNGNWVSKNRWYSPQAWEAYNSAFYDGNNGRIGRRMGIKNADPTIQVVLGGDAYGRPYGGKNGWTAQEASYQYLRSLAYFSYYNRTDHRLPFDIWNFHSYPTESSLPGNATSPEEYYGKQNIRQFFQSVVDSAREVCFYCDVWETEWGYDRNRRSKTAPPVIPGKDSAMIQAEWEARSIIMSLFVRGMGRLFKYQLKNDPMRKDYDEEGTTTYNTSGLLDGWQSPVNYYSNYYAYPAYYYQRTIYTVLKDYKPDSILYEKGLHEAIYEYRFRSVTHRDSVAYVIWSGTQTNKRVTGFKMKTGHPGVVLNDIQLKYKFMEGDTTKKVADQEGAIPLEISESPQIILTKEGISGGRLIGVEDPDSGRPGTKRKVISH